jgi:hypothetical protein
MEAAKMPEKNLICKKDKVKISKPSETDRSTLMI